MTALRVTDHALVRFLERAGGLDVQAVRKALGASLERAHEAASQIGAANYTIKADGLIYVVREGVLVTVHGTDGR